ncbi:hypothetical protein PRIC2_010980 [Phytophthora ramorum]
MASELEKVLALLDAPGATTEALQFCLPPSADDWDTDLLCGLLDGDIEDLGESAIIVHENPETKSKKRKKINPNKARDERRFQLIQLQEEVEELQFTLKQLQTIRDNRPTRVEMPETDTGVPPVWKEICTRQVTRRVEAERENVRLKQQYEREKQLVRSFEKLLFNRRSRKDAGPEERKHTRRTDIPDGYVERMAALIFKELAAGVKICYRMVENIFQTNRPVPMNMVTHSSLVDGGTNMKDTEKKFYNRRTMPFSMHAAGDAWWEIWHNYRGQRFQDIASNELIERFGLEMSDFKSNSSLTAYAQQISQRHVEDDRIVFVWDAYVEPFGFESARVGGVYFMEQTYVLIEPEDGYSGGDDGASTRVSTCYVITPYFMDPKKKKDTKTVAVVNFLVSALSSNVLALGDMVETLLLDQAMQQCA